MSAKVGQTSQQFLTSIFLFKINSTLNLRSQECTFNTFQQMHSLSCIFHSITKTKYLFYLFKSRWLSLLHLLLPLHPLSIIKVLSFDIQKKMTKILSRKVNWVWHSKAAYKEMNSQTAIFNNSSLSLFFLKEQNSFRKCIAVVAMCYNCWYLLFSMYSWTVCHSGC